MHFFLSALITVALAFSAVAVDIDLFPINSTTLCNDINVFFTCADVNPLVCCGFTESRLDIFSARCNGLGVEDFCALYESPDTIPALCASLCSAGSGANSICVGSRDCEATAGKGARWVPRSPAQTVSDALQTKCEQTVEPDRAVFANGQSFRINYDVPAEISALLINLMRTDPQLSKGAPEGAAPYEIKAETEA